MMNLLLTHRERLLRTLRYQSVDRPPDYEFGAWVQTIDRWSGEGMDVRACNGLGRKTYYVEQYFNTDDAEYGPTLNVNVGLLPMFEEIVLEERGDSQIIQDRDGAICEQLRPELGASIPRYLRYAIQTRADWEKMRDERLNPDHPERLPRYLDALARRLRDADYPVVVRMGSLYGWIRNWMGVENLSLALYDDPSWVEAMMEQLTRLALGVLEKLAGRWFVIDRADWWEDMCYRSGSLLSTRMFARLMVPRYKRITDFLRRELGCEFNQLDCDGNIHQLVPLWLEGGINVMFPIEVAHTDVFRIADQFGQRVALRGAFDKRALIEGPAAIDAELERLRPLLARGGFIPHTDHLVPPDVPWEHYLYYRRRKCELIGKPWRAPDVQPRTGHVMTWRLLGPFDNTGNAGFHAAYPPEPIAGVSDPTVGKGGRELRWRTYRNQAASGYVDLVEALGHEPWCMAYAACEVYSPDERDGWLELGSDDGLAVWLNGEELLRRDVYRPAAPGQDLVPVRLRQGRNDLLLKISQAEGDWGFHCRLADDRGRAWSDVEVKV